MWKTYINQAVNQIEDLRLYSWNNIEAKSYRNGVGDSVCGYLRLKSLKTSTYELVFKEPYFISFKNNGNQYYAQDLSLSLFAFGETISELEENINNEFAFMWDFIVAESSDNLTEDAITIKSWLTENLIVVKEA